MEHRQPPARVSWEERNQEHNEDFIKANLWQREVVELRVNSQDGFLVLIGLFVVLVLENLWSLETDTFTSEANLEVFLILLVCAAASGVFSIFSITMIRLKLQRLMVRDIASLRVQQVPGQGRSHLDRLLDGWKSSSAQRQFQPACISYEWYNGGGVNHGRAGICSKRWNPSCPRSLVKYASFSFAITVVSSMAALAVKLADTKGVLWTVLGSVILGMGIVLPMVFIRGSMTPDGLAPSEKSPFQGF
eukprot:g15631.t1